MRVSFVGEYYDDFDEMQLEAKATAAVSHNHPEGIKGAVVTATCIMMAKHGKSKQEIYDYVLREYPPEDYEYSIAYSLEELRPRYRWNETCQGSVPAAMRCFFESTDYESFMRNVISLNCDTDTFGAIAGGVAEDYDNCKASDFFLAEPAIEFVGIGNYRLIDIMLKAKTHVRRYR